MQSKETDKPKIQEWTKKKHRDSFYRSLHEVKCATSRHRRLFLPRHGVINLHLPQSRQLGNRVHANSAADHCTAPHLKLLVWRQAADGLLPVRRRRLRTGREHPRVGQIEHHVEKQDKTAKNPMTFAGDTEIAVHGHVLVLHRVHVDHLKSKIKWQSSGSFVDWLIDCILGGFINWLVHWSLRDWYCSIDWRINRLIDRLLTYFQDRVIGQYLIRLNEAVDGKTVICGWNKR